jgi:predicted nucleic acid-binding protein
MRFWDSSGIVPLLVTQSKTRSAQRILSDDREVLVWWASETECASAIARLEREALLDQPSTTQAFERLDDFKGAWHEIQPSEAIRTTARRLLRVHNLRAADSLQLAAALTASEARPASLDIVSLDDRLVDAAVREGLGVVATE